MLSVLPVSSSSPSLWELWETRSVFQGAEGAVFGFRRPGSFHSESGERGVATVGTLVGSVCDN